MDSDQEFSDSSVDSADDILNMEMGGSYPDEYWDIIGFYTLRVIVPQHPYGENTTRTVYELRFKNVADGLDYHGSRYLEEIIEDVLTRLKRDCSGLDTVKICVDCESWTAPVFFWRPMRHDLLTSWLLTDELEDKQNICFDEVLMITFVHVKH